MKTALRLVLAFLTCVGASFAAVTRERRARGGETSAPGAIAALDVEALLWAIRQVESGDNPRAVGRCGERTAYQFLPATWARYTGLPLILAVDNPQWVERIARSHLARILRTLDKRGLRSEPEFIAAAWNRGEGFPLRAVRSDYARRVADLYRERAEGKS